MHDEWAGHNLNTKKRKAKKKTPLLRAFANPSVVFSTTILPSMHACPAFHL
jgi:hypothetical protein